MYKDELKGLTGIRFFAAIHVVLYHNFYLFGSITENTHSLVQSFFNKGEVAVSFFFVLSGFILTHVYKDKMNSTLDRKKFLLARFAKLYPLYVLGFLLDLPRGILYFLENNTFEIALVKISTSSIAYLLMLQSWIPQLTPNWNSPAWSLSCEAFFYIVFTIFITKILSTKKDWILSVMSIAIPACLYIFLESTNFDFENSLNKVLFRSFPLLRIFEFILGILAYKYISSVGVIQNYIKNNSNFIFWSSLLASIFFGTQDSLPFKPMMYFFIFMPLFICMIISTYSQKIKGLFFIENNILKLLGASSYALYITHQPIHSLFARYTNPGMISGSIYFILIIPVSVLLYKFIELPLQKKIKLFIGKYLSA